MEQYRALVLALEDTVKEEKEVGWPFVVDIHDCPVPKMNLFVLNVCNYLDSCLHGDPTQGVKGGAESAGEEDYRGGEKGTAGARGKEKGQRVAGETSKCSHQVQCWYWLMLSEIFYVII